MPGKATPGSPITKLVDVQHRERRTHPDPVARQAPPFRVGKDSADGVAVFAEMFLPAWLEADL